MYKKKLLSKAMLLASSMIFYSQFVLADATTGAFDLFGLFVEQIFGSIFLAGIGVGLMLYLIGWYTRMSPLMVNYVVILYICAYLLGVMGWAFFGVVILVISVGYFINQIWKYMQGV